MSGKFDAKDRDVAQMIRDTLIEIRKIDLAVHESNKLISYNIRYTSKKLKELERRIKVLEKNKINDS